jgi:hypothetical protein
MSNLDNLLNIHKYTEIPIGYRFLSDLVAIADKVEQKQLDFTHKQLIDGLMIYYAKSNRPGVIRRRQSKRGRLDA